MIPAGFTARPATSADVVEAALVITAAEAAHCSEITDDMSEDGVLEWLGGYDLAADTTLVRASPGEFAVLGMGWFGLLGTLSASRFRCELRHGR